MTEPAPVPPPPVSSAPVLPALVPIVRAAMRSRCPRCADGPLFAGMTAFAPHCPACGLDFRQFNVGDGPAAFLILVVGGIITALAVILQIKAEPPFWVHVILWVPLTAAAVVGGLRATKAWLLQAEYRRKASEAVNAEWTIQPEDGE